jgi:hypothetical protein
VPLCLASVFTPLPVIVLLSADNMNSEMYLKWMKGRLIPTFKAKYGPGTELGGEHGKQMILVLVSIDYILQYIICIAFTILLPCRF